MCRRPYQRAYRHTPKRVEQIRKWVTENRDKTAMYEKTYLNKEPNRRADKHLKRMYGITTNDRDKLFEEQGKVCAICKSPNPSDKKGWCVDHDHISEKIRGVLCGKCNSGLGYFNENIAILTTAIEYLSKHATSNTETVI